MASTLGKINPFRYHGYVYDEETGLYYLRSRYFNVAIVRFINADSILSDANMYCYCKNNAINSKDPNGFDGEPLVSDQLEPFKRTNWGSHDTPVPASIVIKNAITMAREGDWMYEEGKLRYDANGEKRVDCISVITISAKFHMTWRTFTKVYNVRSYTGGSIRNHTASGKTTPIYDISLLKPGTILFNESESHAGIYIGYYNDGQGKEYLHAVVQAQSPDGDGAGKVIVHDFSDPACTYVSYAEFNYIDYDITYADTLISNDFSSTIYPSAYE